MKIYFAASIRGGGDDIEKYQTIIDHLKNFGEVLTEHVGNKILRLEEQNMTDKDIYERDVSWLKKADVLVAEVSMPSLGVGYEIAKTEKFGKKILCIHNIEKQKLSAMIQGNMELTVKKYKNLNDVFKIIDDFFALLKE